MARSDGARRTASSRREAVVAIVDDVLGPQVAGRDPRDAVVIQEDLYDLMRVRGHFGGFYVDAIAGVDIALWDLFGKLVGQPVAKLLGGHRRDSIPAYVSGLPGATLADKVTLARDFAARGFDAFKYAAAVSFDGIEEEMRALREALGPEAKLMVDLHWKFTAGEAIALIERLAPYRRTSSRRRARRKTSKARRRSPRRRGCRSRLARSCARCSSIVRDSRSAR